jgi:hypothetical protein
MLISSNSNNSLTSLESNTGRTWLTLRLSKQSWLLLQVPKVETSPERRDPPQLLLLKEISKSREARPSPPLQREERLLKLRKELLSQLLKLLPSLPLNQHPKRPLLKFIRMLRSLFKRRRHQ